MHEVNTLRTLQQEYETWREQLPASLADSRTAEMLDEICDLDIDALDIDLPKGFGTWAWGRRASRCRPTTY